MSLGKLTTHFQIFYLKDLTWPDNDNNMYPGPVVAAQQVLDPSSRSSYPRKERRGGGGGGGGEGAHPLQPSLQESKSQGLMYVYLLRMFGKVFYFYFSYTI